jgi:lipopolysaccharide transport system permease protein
MQQVKVQEGPELMPEGGRIAPELEIPTVVIQPTHGLAALQLRAVWAYRELLFVLVWRDVKVRYKQTAMGIAWIVLQPVISTVVFTVVFGRLLQVPSGDLPYPVFALVGLVPWNYFAGSLTRSSTSLVGSSHLISKVYFPRLIIPFSNVLSGLVDFGVTLAVLVVLMFIYRVTPTWGVLLLPAFLLLAGGGPRLGLWLGALNVRYRDVNHLVPFLVQIWMLPDAGSVRQHPVPERTDGSWAEPMTAVVGFRWAPWAAQPPRSAAWVWQCRWPSWSSCW